MWTTLESFGRRMIRELPSLMPYILVVIGLLVVLILARLFVVLLAKKRVSAPSEAEEEDGSSEASGATSQAALSSIRDSFRAAMRQLRRLMRKRGYHIDWFVRFTGHSYRYELPWFAVLGEEGSGKTTMLENLPLETPVPPLRADDSGQQGGCNWWFYNQALVIDVPGRYLYRSEGRTQEEGWSRILGELRKYRSRQPLNGIVLTISCSDLAGQDALSTAEIEEKAARIHNRLRDLQRELGLRLPIYIVLTKGDTVPGFQPLCGELPEEHTDDMLGWSNPHAVDAAYTSEWVEDAFESLQEDLHYAQIQVLEDGVQAEDRDAFFLFPQLLEELKGRLSTYLDELFTQSAYHENFMLRGIYLTGSSGDDAAAQNAQGTDEGPTPVFLKDLFRSKIFEEWKLARPVSAALSWQQWSTRAVQGGVAVLTLLGVFGLWSVGSSLDEDYHSLVSTLDHAQNSIEKVSQWQAATKRSESGTSPGQKLAFESLATSLLQKTGPAASVDLTYFLIPASWFGSVESTIEEAIATAYDQVILRGMRSTLRLRADRLISGGLRSGEKAAAAADTLTLEAMPSYQAWRGYTKDLADLERAVLWYDGLTRQPNLDHFGNLARYLFDVRIQSTLNQSPDVYRSALRAVEDDSIRLRKYKPPATEKMRRYARRFNQSLPRRYGVVARLRQLGTQIDRLAGLSVGDALGNRKEEAELRAVRSGISDVELVLNSPESRWVTDDTLALEAVYGPFLAFADTSSLTEAGLAEDLRADAQSAIDQLQARLSDVSSEMTGPLLKQENGRLQRALTSDVRALRSALGTILDQPFMEPAAGAEKFRSTIPEGRRLQWNVRELQRIVQHIQVYDSVTTTGLSDFPLSMRRTARQAAASGLSDHLPVHLGKAQSFVLDVPGGTIRRREAQLQRRADRFREALTPLNTVLTIQGELNMDVARRQLLRVTAAEAFSLLEEVDRLLRAEELYGVAEVDFKQWQGRRSPNVVAINARDTQRVRRYLQVQRERLTFLATTLAGPVLSFLQQWEDRLQIADRPLVSKWQNIRRTLRQYENQTAGNSLSVFENFISSEMSGVDPVSYFLETSADRVSQKDSDFFLRKRNALRRSLYRRSRELALQGAKQGYQALASTFNQELSGRFPFATLEGNRTVQDASPNAVKQFYEQYGRYVTTYRPVLEKTGRGAQALQFLDRLAANRPFFGPVLDNPSTYPIPTVDVIPDFRVNRSSEKLGSHIIHWDLAIGSDRASLGRTDTLHWAAGDPIVVRLRWASDAPSRPIEAERGSVNIEARTASYRYGGQWALLRLIRRHAAPPRVFSRRVDPDPHTLRFIVHVKGRDTGSQARVFIRTYLHRPDESARVVLSEPFPRQAPAFTSKGQPE